MKFSTIDNLQGALSFHRERHTVLAGNVANLDTPGYRPFDLQRPKVMPGAQLQATEPGHLGAGSAPSSAFVTSFDDGGTMQGPDGNAVSLERELAKIDANRTRYATATELVSRRLALLRYTAGDGNG